LKKAKRNSSAEKTKECRTTKEEMNQRGNQK
jgi:hypothetical protein